MNAFINSGGRRGEPRFEAIFKAEPECVKVLDRNGRILQMNPAGLGILEAKTSDEVVGRPMFDFVEPSQTEEVKECFFKALKWEHVTCSFEVIGLHGARHWMESHMVAMQQPNGDPIEVLAVARDITREKETEAALRASEERFRLLVENSSELMVELTSKGVFVYVNPAFKPVLGYEGTELLGNNLRGWVHPEDLPLAARLFKGGAASATFRFQHANGAWRYVDARARRFKDSHGHELLAVTMRDVTQRFESKAVQSTVETRLVQAQKMEALGTLAGGIAHDFNNILAAIIGYAELARLTIPHDNPAFDAVSETLRASSRATDLVRQILTFSRQQEHERKVIQVTPIVCEVGKLLRAALPASIEIHTIIAPALPNILADASQIHQVLMNLGANAAHAMRKQGGVLEMVVGRVILTDATARAGIGLNPGTYLRMVVRDTGEGMSPEVMQRMFEPFFTTKAAGEGTGLGLSVVHGIVKAHDGAISVTSDPANGSSFEIYFPAVEDRALNGTASPEIPMGRGEKILYVDDEEALCRLVEHSLGRCGYRGVTRSDPVEALRFFIEDPTSVSAVITDFTMPKMSGLELAAEIRKVAPETPVIITTGFTASFDLEAFKLSNVDDVLAKPFTMQRLAESLSRVVKRG
ncbi:MAG TPA: PAS domain S-box protein [Verrucomicrobiae bacterium]|nr:PAS domain S-box protein [Verrucomicrobiae bacterium]